MGIINFKPTPLSQRFKSVSDFAELTTNRPYKKLTEIRKRTGGRNAHGHITSRYMGGGHKQRIRLVDFRRLRHGANARVLTIEYDPNRTARVALVEYEDKTKSYILAPDGLRAGMTVTSGPDSDVKVGNHLPLEKIPPATPVHNIELIPGQGAKMVRSAGGVAQILAKEGDFVHIKLPSGEVRMVRANCYATVGQCSNIDHENISIGKAGRKRWMGRSPHVRGVAMNPVDHPLGGGEGKSSGGRHPCSPWGQIAKGLKTRRRSKPTNRFIVKDRRK